MFAVSVPNVENKKFFLEELRNRGIGVTSKSVGVPRDAFVLARQGIGVTSNSSLF